MASVSAKYVRQLLDWPSPPDSAEYVRLNPDGTIDTAIPGAAANDDQFNSFPNAVDDCQIVASGISISALNNNVYSTAAIFNLSDVGKTVSIYGAGDTAGFTTPAEYDLLGVITAYISPTQVTLDTNAQTSVSDAAMIWGTDNRNYVQSVIDANIGKRLYFKPTGNGTGKLFFSWTTATTITQETSGDPTKTSYHSDTCLQFKSGSRYVGVDGVELIPCFHAPIGRTESQTDVRFEDLFVDRVHGGGRVFIPLDSVDIFFSKCNFDSSTYADSDYSNTAFGIKAAGTCKNIQIVQCKFRKISWSVWTFTTSTSEVISVVLCDFEYCSKAGVGIDVPSSGATFSGLKVALCNFKSIGAPSTVGARGVGVGLSGNAVDSLSEIEIIGNTFVDCRRQAVHLERGVSKAEVANNTMLTTANDGNETWAGVVLVTATGNPKLNDINVHDNTIDGGGFMTYGIHCDCDGNDIESAIHSNRIRNVGYGIYGKNAANADIYNNKISNTTNDGIKTESTFTNSEISDNKMANIGGVELNLGGGAGVVVRHKGTGVPSIPCAVGSEYRRTDGGAGSTLYIKESGTSASGWVAK